MPGVDRRLHVVELGQDDALALGRGEAGQTGEGRGHLDGRRAPSAESAAGSRFRRTSDVLRGQEGQADQDGGDVGGLCLRRDQPRPEQRQTRPQVRFPSRPIAGALQPGQVGDFRTRPFVQRLAAVGRGWRSAQGNQSGRPIRAQRRRCVSRRGAIATTSAGADDSRENGSETRGRGCDDENAAGGAPRPGRATDLVQRGGPAAHDSHDNPYPVGDGVRSAVWRRRLACPGSQDGGATKRRLLPIAKPIPNGHGRAIARICAGH